MNLNAVLLRIRCVVGVVAVSVILGGCEEPGSKDAHSRPVINMDLGPVTETLRSAKELLEGYGAKAKKHAWRNWETKYTKAVADHNGCISLLKTSLGGDLDKNSLGASLRNADESRTAFVTWCEQNIA